MAQRLNNIRTGHLFIGCPNVKLRTENHTTNIDTDADHAYEVMAINSHVDVQSKDNTTNITVGENNKTAAKYHFINTTGKVSEDGCKTYIGTREDKAAESKKASPEEEEYKEANATEPNTSPQTRLKIRFQDEPAFTESFYTNITVSDLINYVLKKYNVEKDEREFRLKCNGKFKDETYSLNDAGVCDSAVYIQEKII